MEGATVNRLVDVMHSANFDLDVFRGVMRQAGTVKCNKSAEKEDDSGESI